MGLEKQAAVVEPEQGSLYCLYTDGTVKKQVENVTISNGLAWSADNKTMFYIDSIPRCVYAFDYDIENGNVGMYFLKSCFVLFQNIKKSLKYSKLDQKSKSFVTSSELNLCRLQSFRAKIITLIVIHF